MKTYKVITIKQGALQNIDKVAEEVEKELNYRTTSEGCELVDISWASFSTSMGGLTAFLTFRY